MNHIATTFLDLLRERAGLEAGAFSDCEADLATLLHYVPTKNTARAGLELLANRGLERRHSSDRQLALELQDFVERAKREQSTAIQSVQLDYKELVGELPEPKWLLRQQSPSERKLGKGMMPKGKVCILAGAGGVGKTSLVCSLALEVAIASLGVSECQALRKGNWLGFEPCEHGVLDRTVLLFLGEEEETEIKRRIRNCVTSNPPAKSTDIGYEDAMTKILSRIHGYPLAGRKSALIERTDRYADPVESGMVDLIRKEIERHNPALVVLDPLSRFAGADAEKDNGLATRVIEIVESLLSGLEDPPTILLVHHTNKDANESGSTSSAAIRGASAFVDGARWAAVVTSKTVDDGKDSEPEIFFDVCKSNYSSKPAKLHLVMDNGILARKNSSPSAARAHGKPLDEQRIRKSKTHLEPRP